MRRDAFVEEYLQKKIIPKRNTLKLQFFKLDIRGGSVQSPHSDRFPPFSGLQGDQPPAIKTVDADDLHA